MLSLNILLGQEKTVETGSDFKQSKDTVTIYERNVFNDSIRIFKKQYYYDTLQALTLKQYEPLKYKHSIWRQLFRLNKPDKLVFVYKRTCTVSENRNVLALTENLLKSTKKEHRAECKKFNTKWYVTVGKRKESFKTCSCLLAQLFYFKSQTSCPPMQTSDKKGGVY